MEWSRTEERRGAAWVQGDPDLAGEAVVVSRDRLGPGPTHVAPVADRTTAAFLAVCRQLGVRCGALLVVTSDADGRRLDGDALLDAEQRLGRAGAERLGLPVPPLPAPAPAGG